MAYQPIENYAEFSAFLCLRPSGHHGLAPLLAKLLFAEGCRPSLAALPAQSNRGRILVYHSPIILRTVT
jgi:hypothetical protein